MPRKKQPVHSYSVYLTSYATQEIKDRVTSGQDYLSSADQLVTTALYLGSSGVAVLPRCARSHAQPARDQRQDTPGWQGVYPADALALRLGRLRTFSR